MANFINREKAGFGWYPKPGELVEGYVGLKRHTGKVEASFKNPTKPAIFQRLGFVGCYVLCTDGKRRALYELAPIGDERAESNRLFN